MPALSVLPSIDVLKLAQATQPWRHEPGDVPGLQTGRVERVRDHEGGQLS